MLKMAQVFEKSFLPVVSAIEHKIRMEHDIWERAVASWFQRVAVY